MSPTLGTPPSSRLTYADPTRPPRRPTTKIAYRLGVGARRRRRSRPRPQLRFSRVALIRIAEAYLEGELGIRGDLELDWLRYGTGPATRADLDRLLWQLRVETPPGYWTGVADAPIDESGFVDLEALGAKYRAAADGVERINGPGYGTLTRSYASAALSVAHRLRPQPRGRGPVPRSIPRAIQRRRRTRTGHGRPAAANAPPDPDSDPDPAAGLAGDDRLERPGAAAGRSAVIA